ncbi:isocitrate/isopropylmalate family dehydrogenase, partial [Escherichia coli]|nr:isocitrate/isopropylmalate family dehydrogenase [Escherichia coli]
QLWRASVSRLAREEFPEIELEHMYVDACAMHLVTNPSRFDVILTENLFGDILSDESAVLTGSLGTLASATIGGKVGLFEPVHGS